MEKNFLRKEVIITSTENEKKKLSILDKKSDFFV